MLSILNLLIGFALCYLLALWKHQAYGFVTTLELFPIWRNMQIHVFLYFSSNELEVVVAVCSTFFVHWQWIVFYHISSWLFWGLMIWYYMLWWFLIMPGINGHGCWDGAYSLIWSLLFGDLDHYSQPLILSGLVFFFWKYKACCHSSVGTCWLHNCTQLLCSISAFQQLHFIGDPIHFIPFICFVYMGWRQIQVLAQRIVCRIGIWFQTICCGYVWVSLLKVCLLLW